MTGGGTVAFVRLIELYVLVGITVRIGGPVPLLFLVASCVVGEYQLLARTEIEYQL